MTIKMATFVDVDRVLSSSSTTAAAPTAAPAGHAAKGMAQRDAGS